MPISSTSAQEIAKHVGAASGLATIAGNDIFYEALGSGPVLIFLHDGIAHSVGFAAQMAALTGDYTTIRYDRPGYGSSKPPSVAYSDVVTLKGVFDTLGIETAILVGGSRGGGLALDFAVAHPTSVEALILIGAWISGLRASDHMRNRGGRNTYGDTTAEFIEFWVTDPWLIAEENQAARASLRQLLTDSPQNLMNFPVELLDDTPAFPHLAEIHAPTLVLVGESDIADNHAHSGILEVSIKDSERQVITHAGHLAHMEQPDKISQLISEFLNRRVNKARA